MKKIWFEDKFNGIYPYSWEGWLFFFGWAIFNMFVLVNIVDLGWIPISIFLISSFILTYYIIDKKKEKKE